ncbi:hypothetical protein lerEdw1_006993 [Lerista edwardsae]|nr:hypothetical protein lerEdw1_006993 [Lerista edwardsae]
MAGSAAASSRGPPPVYDLYTTMEYGPVPEGTGAAQDFSLCSVPFFLPVYVAQSRPSLPCGTSGFAGRTPPAITWG